MTKDLKQESKEKKYLGVFIVLLGMLDIVCGILFSSNLKLKVIVCLIGILIIILGRSIYVKENKYWK